jgi:hypothetical protein
MKFYNDLDSNKKGSVTIFDLCRFYLSNKEEEDSYSTIFTLFANYIACKRLTP